MTNNSDALAQRHDHWLLSFVAIAVFITALRLAVVAFTDVDLLPDEAQYWSWAQEPTFGYYSKPPLIAWLIGLATTVCGDSEACIRAPSALVHAVTAAVLYAFVRPFARPQEAFFVGLTYLALPAVWLSTTIISTDVPLLLLWAISLLAYHRLLESRSTGWAIATGIALGVGLLAKYAMVYFALCACLLFALAPQTRWLVRSRQGVIVAGLALLIFAPNVMWNALNKFPTFAHTADNANWQGDLLNWQELGEFFFSQFAVLGPLLFGALLVGLAALVRTSITRRIRPPDVYVYLASFTVPPLLIVTVQSFLSRAHANWAAVSYVAGTALVVLWLLRSRGRWLVPASLALHTIAGLYIYGLILGADALPGRRALLAQRAGWEALGQGVVAQVGTESYGAVIAMERKVMASLLYYARDIDTPLQRWPSDGRPLDHFQLTRPWHSDAAQPVLLVSRFEAPNHILGLFEQSKLVRTIRAGDEIGRPRDYYLYAAQGFRG